MTSKIFTAGIPSPPRDFLAVAGELALLSREVAEQVAQEAAERQLPPERIIAQKGLLGTVEVDIIETLVRPHQIVPGYEILSLIGRGGMGVVYRARQKSLNREVAIKTVLVNQLADPAAVQRFEQEAIAVARLAHPHIIAAFDFGQHEGRLYFVMELVEGEDAQRLCDRRGALSEAFAWGLIRQAASGLSHAAQAGVVHRDIKPANLLLVQPPAGFPLPPGLPMVKIADFGLALLAVGSQENQTRLTMINTALGSPHYMAPEQLQAGDIDLRADIYALGATAYHLLAGKPPLAGQTMAQIISHKLITGIGSIQTVRPDVSSASAQLLAAMLATEVANRLGSYAELLHRIDALPLSDLPTQPLNQALSHEAALAAAPTQQFQVHTLPLPAVTRQPVSRRWLLGAGGGALAVVAVGALAWSVQQARNAAGPRDLIPVGDLWPLFSGQNISQWQSRSGAWSPGRDDDMAVVLTGASGVAARPLLGLGKPADELQHYRLELALAAREATAVELHFDLTKADRNAPRLVVRLTAEGVLLGRREGDLGKLTPLRPIKPHRGGYADNHTITLERQRRAWWVLVDEELIGTLPFLNQPPVPEICLAVERGPAWFSDITIQDLTAN